MRASSGNAWDLDAPHHGSSSQSLAGMLWNLGCAIGRVAVFLLCLVLLLVLLGGSLGIREKLSRLLPQSVVDSFFAQENSKDKPSRLDKLGTGIRDALGTHGPRPHNTPEKASGFTVGSTKEQVQALQGPPSRMGPNVWNYGDSEVYFVGDRVVSWRSSSAHPLRTR